MEHIFIGENPLKGNEKEVKGRFVTIDNETFYQIVDYDVMPPFFISLSSESDLWMYISSTGGLTAGRKNADTALFPYYTDDKIADAGDITGSKTIIHVTGKERVYVWEPFSDRFNGVYNVTRTLSKNTTGNKLIFSEYNHDLGLVFEYRWTNASQTGWIKKSCIKNLSNQVIRLNIVDGLQNILPAGVDKLTQNTFSTLVDGYKKTELIENLGLVLFRMESLLSDRAEPSEALRANTVWITGMKNNFYLLSSRQLDAFRKGRNILPEIESKGVRGAIFSCGTYVIKPDQSESWYFIADVNQDIIQINKLIKLLRDTKDLTAYIEKNIESDTKALRLKVALADGIQHTTDQNANARHFSNVLFNIMRGGTYVDEYTISISSFSKHMKVFNICEWKKNAEFLATLPESLSYGQLESLILKQNNINLYRLFLEYLPLTFSRRHGDPSRPWNHFNIQVKDKAGNPVMAYQGNWRDIFQNWEALSLSYPGYIHGIIAKFLNASTVDGYNPYRITNTGIEWEVIEPDNPWSNIGYWGDHQIVYLLRLMELSDHHFPGVLNSWLHRNIFTYANVPYRLKDYDQLVADPKNTILFDDTLHKIIESAVALNGTDARLIHNQQGELIHVSLTEKLLVSLLSKLTNFIPEAGIWMNTLRPEWNDANNALVGNGTSMVTLYYLRRFVTFMKKLIVEDTVNYYLVTEDILILFSRFHTIFKTYEDAVINGFDNIRRRLFTDETGKAGNEYRQAMYNKKEYTKTKLKREELIRFLKLTLKYIDQSIKANKRSDHMYHAYNLVSFSPDSIIINHLNEMLEGQVAILSSGLLNINETLELLDSMRNSTLYRADQESYMLYPDKRLPLFVEKNRIEKEDIEKITTLMNMVNKGDTSIIEQDEQGIFHFNADFNNVRALENTLHKLNIEQKLEIPKEDMFHITKLYEKTFRHQYFTGRSGTFYKYEGLGSIYWHMVSKLLLAIGENISILANKETDKSAINRLISHYQQIKKGIGASKSPVVYGSFPIDPYSHTPSMSGVQQPGMTGQVKEDIISRFMELGVSVENGQIHFTPLFLNKNEFVCQTDNDTHPHPFLSFSYCGIPITYLADDGKGIEIVDMSCQTTQISSYALTTEQSRAVFYRESGIKQVIVHLPDQKIPER